MAFWLNAPVVIRAKVKKCEQTLLFIAMHYWGYTSLEVEGWWGLLLPLYLLITTVQQPGTSSPPSWLKCSSEGVIWMCRATAPVVCHGPALWSPPDGSGGDSPTHAPLQLTFPSACERGMMEKSAVAEHAWENHHMIHWEETTVLDHGRGQELLVKEVQMTTSEERFNWDGGLKDPGCWTAVMRRLRGRSNPHRPFTSNDVYSQYTYIVHGYK